jgi:hypothetical protein
MLEHRLNLASWGEAPLLLCLRPNVVVGQTDVLPSLGQRGCKRVDRRKASCMGRVA